MKRGRLMVMFEKEIFHGSLGSNFHLDHYEKELKCPSLPQSRSIRVSPFAKKILIVDRKNKKA